jgi:ankyrin repeat protein
MIYNYNRFIKLNENIQEWNEKLLEYSRNGNLNGVIECIKNGADVNYETGNNSWTPLIWSSSNGHLEIVKVLIENGVDVNYMDNSGGTPLIWSSENGHLEIVKVLIENSGNVNCKDYYGWTPLMYSSYNNHLDIVKVLIEHGVNWNIKDDKNNDFMNFLSEENKEIITREYPEQYKEYLFKKDVKKYNL